WRGVTATVRNAELGESQRFLCRHRANGSHDTRDGLDALWDPSAFRFRSRGGSGENGPTGIGIYSYLISAYWRGTCAGCLLARAPGNAPAGPTRLTGSIIAIDPNIERQRSSWTPEEGKGQISSTRRAYLTKPTVTWFTDPRGLKRKPC